MKTSYFSINEEGVSIRSKFYGTDARTYKRIVIFSHGFGGHKDNKSAEKFAEKILSKYKDIAVISFDWPCHGEDAIKQLALSDCDKYLGLVIDMQQALEDILFLSIFMSMAILLHLLHSDVQL